MWAQRERPRPGLLQGCQATPHQGWLVCITLLHLHLHGHGGEGGGWGRCLLTDKDVEVESIPGAGVRPSVLGRQLPTQERGWRLSGRLWGAKAAALPVGAGAAGSILGLGRVQRGGACRTPAAAAVAL